MRVIGRVLFGTLAVVFAMVFIARLVRGGSPRGRKFVQADRLPRESSPALPEIARSYLAAQPGGPALPAAGRRRQKRSGQAKVQKTVGAMNYVVCQSAPKPQHAPDESLAFTGAVPRCRSRTG
jgi:hypothetical protein